MPTDPELTPLAELVWPEDAGKLVVEEVHRLVGAGPKDGFGVRTEGGSLRVQIMHPNAREGLRAALEAMRESP